MRRIGKTYFTNDADDLTPLLPFFILDEVYQLYSKYVLPLQCKHDARHWKTVWGKTYTKLNQDFFSSFNADQTDAVIDRMDGFEEFIAPLLKQTLDSVSAFLSPLVPQDKCPVISACMVCSVLAQCASIIWYQVYRDGDKNASNPLIEKLIHVISQFRNSWHKPDRHIVANDDSKVDESVNLLQSRIVAWLHESHDCQTETDSDKT